MRRIFATFGLVLSLVSETAHADGLSNACSIVGCSALAPTAIGDLAIAIANLMIYSAAGLCVLFVIYGGLQMIASVGDESKFQKGRNSALFALTGFGLAVASQSLLAFVAATADFSASGSSNPIVNAITNISNLLLSVFNAVFVIAIVVAGFQMVTARGATDKFDTGKRTVLFCVFGALTINLAKFVTNYLLLLGL